MISKDLLDARPGRDVEENYSQRRGMEDSEAQIAPHRQLVRKGNAFSFSPPTWLQDLL